MPTLPKPAEQPVEFATGLSGFVNAVLLALVSFGYVHWSGEQVALVATIANGLLAAGIWLFLRVFTTSRAKPTTKEGAPLAPVLPATRGLTKG